MATRNGKFQLSQSALIIGVFSLLSVGSWIAFDLYRALVKTTLPEVLQAQIQPLPTEINEEVLADLRGRLQLDEATLNQVETIPAQAPEGGAAPTGTALPPITAPTPTPTVSIATSSAQVATQSGEISQ